MVDRRDLEGALLRATDWVQAEYAYIEDVAVGMGCEKRLESGPGVAFRLEGKVICRAHPKRDHLAVGLPDRMRSDVQALTLVLRAQKLFAWFNYEPGVADRDKIELLLSSSADLARSTTRRTQSNLRDNNQVPPNDEADLRLILTVLRAFQNHETATGDTSAAKPLRERLFFRWEAPRLPPGGKYSPLIPHSPAARDQYATHASKGLVYEHVVPISGVIRELLRNMPTMNRRCGRYSARQQTASSSRKPKTAASPRLATETPPGPSGSLEQVPRVGSAAVRFRSTYRSVTDQPTVGGRCGKVTVVPSLKVVAKHGEAAIRDAVATVGFTLAEELQHPFVGHTELYFRSALPEAYFGRAAFRCPPPTGLLHQRRRSVPPHR